MRPTLRSRPPRSPRRPADRPGRTATRRRRTAGPRSEKHCPATHVDLDASAAGASAAAPRPSGSRANSTSPLTDNWLGSVRTGGCAARARSASNASTSAAQPSVSVTVSVGVRSTSPGRPARPRVRRRYAGRPTDQRARWLRQRCPAAGFVRRPPAPAPTAPRRRRGRRTAAERSMISLSSHRNSDGPRGLIPVAPQWCPDTSSVSSARVTATYNSRRSSSTRR